jgi:tRNA threonylcarbamoyladenosine biosynthesis protein TsaB
MPLPENRRSRRSGDLPGLLHAALDCSAECVSVGLALDGACVGRSQTLHQDPRGSSLVGMLQDLLASFGAELKDLDGLVVTRGPGSFTGVRLGLMAAKTLAWTNRIPLLTLDSTVVVASAAPKDRPVAVALDARMGEVYLAFFEAGPLGRRPQTGPEAVPVDQARLRLDQALATHPDLFLLGSGFSAFPQLAALRPGPASGQLFDHPDPALMLALAAPELLAGRSEDLLTCEPFYVRRYEAKVPKDVVPS